MNIQSLLNSPGDGPRRHFSVAITGPPQCLSSSHNHVAPTIVPKRQKLAKDAPVFAEGIKIVGQVNYPPHEAGSNRELEVQHRKFQVFPLGEIQKKGVRHIPYNSDKKDLFQKTGREAFEMFQYTFKVPGNDKEYTMVWDYNVGLVRMTPLFKSLTYSKTVPAKALRENPGLKDISYSITGGALLCQGYWVPYQAAKAIAATFCWPIRWALTPVFGNDFVHMCTPPQHAQFAKFFIDPNIVKFCTAETARIKEEGTSYQILQPPASLPVPVAPVFCSPAWEAASRLGDIESGYGTDSQRRNNAIFSPTASPLCQHRTKLGGAASPTSPATAYPTAPCSPAAYRIPTPYLLPTPISDTPSGESFRMKRTHSKVAYSDSDDAVAGKVECTENEVPEPLQKYHRPGTQNSCDIAAAETLMAFSMMARNAAAMPDSKRSRRGSHH